jgi:hypothetical protein
VFFVEGIDFLCHVAPFARTRDILAEHLAIGTWHLAKAASAQEPVFEGILG